MRLHRRFLALPCAGLALFGQVALTAPRGARSTAFADEPQAETRLRFSLDIARARAAGQVMAAETDGQILAFTVKAVAARLTKWGVKGAHVEGAGPTEFEVRVPTGADLERILPLVTTLGDLQFRIEVHESYDPWEGKPERPRKSVWDGRLGSLDEYMGKEIVKWKRARDGNTPYVPSDPRFRLVPRRRKALATLENFAVVEEPQEARLRFDERMVWDPRVSRDQSGDSDVVFEVKPEFQVGFGEWTAANIGLPMALLLDGELQSAPIINSRLSDNVQITLGFQSSMAEMAAEAKRLAIVLGLGALRVKPVLVSNTTVIPNLPAEKPAPMDK